MRRCINKKIHYLTFDPGVKVIQKVTQYPLHKTYTPAKFEVLITMVKDKMHSQENTLFDIDIKVTQKVGQYPQSCDLYTCKG